MKKHSLKINSHCKFTSESKIIFNPIWEKSTKNFIISAETIDKINLRLRRDADEQKKDTNDDEQEYDLENEDSDKPKRSADSTNPAQELQNDVKELNYDIK